MRYTGAPERRAELLRRLTATGYVSSQEVATAVGVSEMTIRRDLDQLQQEGRAQRVVGGASLPAADAAGAPFEDRDVLDARAKRAVARAAVAALGTAGTVALDAGTTVAAAAALLPAGVTAITQSLPVIEVCATRPDVELIALGGSYEPRTRSFTGPTTRSQLADLAPDVVLLGATAYDRHGIYCVNPLDADIKRALIAAARRVVLAVDGTKLSARAPIRVAGLGQVTELVTDAPPPWAEDVGLEVCRAALDGVVASSGGSTGDSRGTAHRPGPGDGPVVVSDRSAGSAGGSREGEEER